MRYPIQLLLCLGLYSGLLVGCSRDAAEEVQPEVSKAAEQQLHTLDQESLYLLDSDWKDQTGATRKLEDFSGRIIVTAMIFTNCAYACPRIIVDLKAIEKAIPEGREDEVCFLLISMDTERDTPEVMAEFAKEKGLDPARWTLLTGGDFAVRGIGAALGVRYKQGLKGDFAHSNVITVLDVSGRVVHQLEGLNGDAASTNESIRAQLP